MSNKIVKICHMKLGRSKSQQEEASGTEGKLALLSLAAFSPFFFLNSHFLLFCPFCTHTREFQQSRTGATVLRQMLPRPVSVTHLSRASVLHRHCEMVQHWNQTGTRRAFLLLCRPSANPAELCARGCAETPP